MTIEKGTNEDLLILEPLPALIELRLLVHHFTHYKHPRKKVFDLVRKGFLELVTNGLYLNLRSHARLTTPLESIANALYFPSYVSAEWALQHYGLLTERVHTITSVTSRISRTFEISLGRFEFFRLHKHRYAFGYQVDPSAGFLIARPEKALLDCLKRRGHPLDWSEPDELRSFLEEDLRLNFAQFQDLITSVNLKDLLPHYHRNAPEARILKWWLAEKENRHA